MNFIWMKPWDKKKKIRKLIGDKKKKERRKQKKKNEWWSYFGEGVWRRSKAEATIRSSEVGKEEEEDIVSLLEKRRSFPSHTFCFSTCFQIPRYISTFQNFLSLRVISSCACIFWYFQLFLILNSYINFTITFINFYFYCIRWTNFNL